MKLIECTVCGDMFNLTSEEKRCSCQASSGAYIDDIKAWVNGPVNVLGISGHSYAQALVNHGSIPYRSKGWRFDAFIIPDNSEHIERRYL